ncbi:sorting nexin [Mortierella sp. AD032]|nr:sorting nexin [Mortierella sp. AD032]
MNTVQDPSDAMVASFSAPPAFEVNDPWGTNTARGLDPMDLSSILSGMPLPTIYTTAFDLAQPVGGRITVSALNKLIAASGLPHGTVSQILNIVVTPTQSRISKGECSVTLALVAMAQKNMDLTVENLIAHREDLPIPHLPGLESIDFGSSSDSTMYPSTPVMPRHHHPIHSDTTVSDPWRNSTISTPKGNGYPPAPSYLASPPITATEILPQSADPEATRKEMYQWFLNLDVIRISFAPEKEGVFLFKHVNYIVESKELAIWRKDIVISTEDEFTTRLPIASSLSKQIPMTLDLEVEAVKRRLPASIEYYRTMVATLDRIQKRSEASAADYTRFSLAVGALADCEKQCHIDDCYNCGQLSHAYGKIGSHFSQASTLMDIQARSAQQGMVESLKRHRDLLISVRELFQRRDRIREGNMSEMLKKRITSNEAKLKTLRTSAANASNGASGAADGGVTGSSSASIGLYDAQIEKVTNNINSDRAELEIQGQRAVLLQHTLWMEITFYHKSHSLIAGMYQSYVHEQMKSSQSLFDNWKSLSPVVHDMPMEVNGFN